MMRKVFIPLLLLTALVSFGVAGEYKSGVRVNAISDEQLKNYLVAPSFTAGEFCTVKSYDSIAWAVTHWVIGNELYKSYQDPTVTCPNPYPFAVEKIYMVLYVEAECSLIVSVDVEAADVTNPACPVPGPLLALSETYLTSIPEAGLYQIEIPLDTPYVVDAPYFAGFFIANYVDTLWNVCIVTDDNPIACVNYNIWDTSIGFVDLTNTGFPSFPSFPGRMLLFSAGTPGGTGPDVNPSITIIKPEMNEKISGTAGIWAVETTGSKSIEMVQFHYRNASGGSWNLIGQDTDGSQALRNGVDASGSGEGWSIGWNYSSLSEGNYWLKATVYDTQDRLDVDSILVSVDPTPPDVLWNNPTAYSSICFPTTLSATTADENVNLMKFEKKNAAIDYLVSVNTLNQNKYGAYYCGPVAAAIAINYWFNKGYIYSMREGAQYMPIDTVVIRLAANMLTAANQGTYDDLFYSGFLQYIAAHGNELRLNIHRRPDYHQFRALFQEQEKLAILALAGTPGMYVVASGVSGMKDDQNRYAVNISNPLTGSIVSTYMRDATVGSEMLYNGVWHPVDFIVTVIGYNHTVVRDFIGTDNSSSGGWTYAWDGTLTEDSLYFVTAGASDATGRTGIASSLIKYTCDYQYLKGDYNDDGQVNIGDVIFLTSFIYEKGTIPVGGAGRADANCDNNIDISDIIFMIKFVFEGGTGPCY